MDHTLTLEGYYMGTVPGGLISGLPISGKPTKTGKSAVLEMPEFEHRNEALSPWLTTMTPTMPAGCAMNQANRPDRYRWRDRPTHS
jgi:hypothetical protein